MTNLIATTSTAMKRITLATLRQYDNTVIGDVWYHVSPEGRCARTEGDETGYISVAELLKAVNHPSK